MKYLYGNNGIELIRWSWMNPFPLWEQDENYLAQFPEEKG
jgi:hypothetical protein